MKITNFKMVTVPTECMSLINELNGYKYTYTLKTNNMKLKKETALLMLKSKDESVRQFAIDNYPEFGVKELPKTWKELGDIKGFCIDVNSRLIDYTLKLPKVYTDNNNRNVFPTKELAEAALALAQLLQLRDRYNGDWKPDWTDSNEKYTIEFYNGHIDYDNYLSTQKVLHFKTAELRNQFLENFRDLIEIAKPLI